MTFASENLTLGQMNAIVKKLGGEWNALRFLRGELLVSAAKPVEMPVWKTVKLGTCKTPDEYRKALKKAGRRTGDWGDDILGRISCSKEENDLDLVVMSVGDLGFKDGAKYSDICAKAVELGLELCPAEVGPALRLQYGDQPSGEWLRIAMEAITGRGGDLYVFYVVRDVGDLWLGGYSGHPDDVWDARSRFVFVGSEYILKDGKLTISLDNLLFPIQKIADAIRDIPSGLEPRENDGDAMDLEQLYSQNPRLLPGLDSNQNSGIQSPESYH